MAAIESITHLFKLLPPQCLHVGSAIRLAILTDDVDRSDDALRVETNRSLAAHSSVGPSATISATREMGPVSGARAARGRPLI